MKSIPVLNLFKIENKFMIAGLALLHFSSFWLYLALFDFTLKKVCVLVYSRICLLKDQSKKFHVCLTFSNLLLSYLTQVKIYVNTVLIKQHSLSRTLIWPNWFPSRCLNKGAHSNMSSLLTRDAGACPN